MQRVIITLNGNILLTLLVFKSAFAEGKSISVGNPSQPENNILHRTILEVEDDFDLLHNILFYLYTGQISFGTDITSEQSEQGFPKLCAAEDIYAMADRFFLDELKEKAFNFLDVTCTVTNITAGALSKFARTYKEVGDMYSAFCRKNWKQVKSSTTHVEVFAKKESEGDMDELIDVFKRYRGIMEDNSWD